MPVLWGGLDVDSRPRRYEARRHPYEDNPIELQQDKTRRCCREDYCPRGSFTESVDETRRGGPWDRQLGAHGDEAGASGLGDDRRPGFVDVLAAGVYVDRGRVAGAVCTA